MALCVRLKRKRSVNRVMTVLNTVLSKVLKKFVFQDKNYKKFCLQLHYYDKKSTDMKTPYILVY